MSELLKLKLPKSKSPKLNTICIATPSVIGPRRVSTGIVKLPVEGQVQVEEMGLEGDFQVDSRVHGGLDKAVYQFPFETYATMSEALPHLAQRFLSPCVGENFSSTGMTDETVFVGDIYRVGTALLQVSQPRMPCWKLNQHVGNSHVMAMLVSLKRTGWYYRVLETGHVEAGNAFILEDRLQDAWTVEAIWTHWLDLRAQKKQVVGSVPVPGLSTQWRFDW